MIFVDTGFFLGALDSRDELHPRAAAWADAVRKPLITTEYVLVEAINACSGTGERGKARQTFDLVTSPAFGRYLPASPKLFRGGWDLFVDRPDKDWSLTDCISFHVMQSEGITQALAYDHHFEQAGFEALLRRDPS